MVLTVNDIELFSNSNSNEVLNVIHSELSENVAIKSIKNNSDVNYSVCSVILEIIERNYAAVGMAVKINAFKVDFTDTGWINPLLNTDNFVNEKEEKVNMVNKKVLKLTNS